LIEYWVIFMRKVILFFVIFVVLIGIYLIIFKEEPRNAHEVRATKVENHYWFMLHRKSNKEYLYRGLPGDVGKSKLVRVFKVKTGIPGERPTPLPKLTGKKYWLIIDKQEEKDNPETAPYFLTLDVPFFDEEPYGPNPYFECGGEQCNWGLPGAFGLHGVNGDESRLSNDNPGSSGCIRHKDEDITYLYNLIDPEKYKVRYYVEDI
jgi:L,D-transpeptidase catalytic domain